MIALPRAEDGMCEISGLLKAFGEKQIPLELASQVMPAAKQASYTFFVGEDQLEKALEVVHRCVDGIPWVSLRLAKLHLVGPGMGEKPELIGQILQKLEECQVVIQAVTVSQQSLTVLVEREHLFSAVSGLEQAFFLLANFGEPASQ